MDGSSFLSPMDLGMCTCSLCSKTHSKICSPSPSKKLLKFDVDSQFPSTVSLLHMNEFHSERAVGKSSLFLVQQNWTSQVALVLKNLPTMQETWVQSLGREDPLEKAMATHSSILA